ncbi:MAG TPA: HNH endonuclease [Kofleriaceae bacterium]|jgi:5-methylcytosine-specific restriction endonuclease McrA
MHVETTRTLLLSRGHEPIQIISWQRALTLLALEKVDVLEEYAAFARSPSRKVAVPAVVRLKKVVRRPDSPVKFSRVNIYARDKHRCQYCGKDCTPQELTYDHVIPRSRGGATTWENIVSACYTCNRKKAARTPSEAGMKLAKRPVRPTWLPATQIRVSSVSIPDAWRDYVYWTAELGTDGE